MTKLPMDLNLLYFFSLPFSNNKIHVIKKPLSTKKISTPILPNGKIKSTPLGAQCQIITNRTAKARIESNSFTYFMVFKFN